MRQGVKAGSPETPITSPTALWQSPQPGAPPKHPRDYPSPLPCPPSPQKNSRNRAGVLQPHGAPGARFPPTPGSVSPAGRGRRLPRAPDPPPSRAPACRPAVPPSCSVPARPGRPARRPPPAGLAPPPCCPAQPPSTPDPEVPSPPAPGLPALKAQAPFVWAPLPLTRLPAGRPTPRPRSSVRSRGD